MRRWPRRGWLYGALFAVTCLPYLQVATHGFLNWDDPWLVSENPLLGRIDLETLGKIFFDLSHDTRMTLGAEYLPLRDLSVLLGKRLWGDWAGGFLLVNVLLYACAVLLLFRLLERMHGSTGVGFLGALLFAVHPIHVESVAWISSRKDVLSLLFFVASLVALESHLRNGRRRTLILGCALYLFALMSKYVAVVLPAFVALRLGWLGLRGADPRRLWRRTAVVLAPLVVISAGYLALVVRVGSSTDVLKSRAAHGLWVDLATTVDVFRRYVFNLLVPLWLSPDYRVDPLTSPTGARGLLAGMFLLLLMASGVWLLRGALRHRDEPRVVTLFWLAWFFVALLPVSQIAPIYNRMTDRYLLLPSLSLAALTAWWGRYVWRRSGTRPLAALAVVYLLVLAGLTARQVTFWQSSIRLWERAVAMQPASSHAWYQLSTSYQEKKRYADEGRALERALAIDPDNLSALSNLGINLSRRGAPIERILPVYARLFEIEPNHYRAMQNLGNALIAAGRYDEAIHWLRRSLSLQPRYCVALLNLGRAYRAKGDLAAARIRFREALACNPNLGAARRLLGGPGEAERPPGQGP